jgi:hypothetical protein
MESSHFGSILDDSIASSSRSPSTMEGSVVLGKGRKCEGSSLFITKDKDSRPISDGAVVMESSNENYCCEDTNY